MKSIRRLRDGKEISYFIIATLGSLLIRLTLLFCFAVLYASRILLPTICWSAFFLIVTVLAMITRMASIRGNLLRVGEYQFPEIEGLVSRLVHELELKRIPEIYIVPHSAPFARAMTSKKYDIIILSTALIELEGKGERDAVRFIVARELCKLALGHLDRAKWVWAANLIPFVGSAYARACVRSADAAGTEYVPEGAVAGLCMSASGPHLLRRLNVAAYLEQAERTRNALSWLAEHLSGTPFLPKRIRACMKNTEFEKSAFFLKL
jgi:hypothetical protein